MADTKANLDGLTSAAEEAKSAVDVLSNSILNSGKGLDALSGMASSSAKSMSSLADGISKFADKIPGLNLASAAFDIIDQSIGTASGALKSLNSLYMDSIRGIDSYTSITREMDKSVYDLAASFGGTLGEAKSFTDFLYENATKLSNQDFGYVSLNETKDALVSLTNAGIPLDTLSKKVETSAGSFDSLSASVLQAGRYNLSMSEYSNILSNAFLKQGLSIQEGMEQIDLFGSIANETGLKVDDVAGSLQGLSDRFRVLGMNANFGKPILSSFTKTVKDMGLGIENAYGLTEDFGAAIAGLSSNYANAHILSQLGGMSSGGGGALGAGIALEAKMLDPETNQAELGLEIAEAMKKAVSSLTGGKIITAQDAAASPELQGSYYAQKNLLGQFGISQQNAGMTLQMLSRLDQAKSSGDTQTSTDLGEQLAAQIDNRNDYMSGEDKTQTAVMGKLLEVTTSGQRDLIEEVKNLGNSISLASADKIAQILQKGLETFSGNKDAAKAAIRMASDMVGDPDGLMRNPERVFSALGDAGSSALNAGYDAMEKYSFDGSSLSMRSPVIEETLQKLVGLLSAARGNSVNFVAGKNGSSSPGVVSQQNKETNP